MQIQLVFSDGSGSTASSGPVSLLPQEWTRLEVHGASSGDNMHSGTGLKLPIRDLSRALQEAAGQRPEERRLLLGLDGVHGFGVEDATPEKLGVDFFMAGRHKWIFGPRGTGLI